MKLCVSLYEVVVVLICCLSIYLEGWR